MEHIYTGTRKTDGREISLYYDHTKDNYIVTVSKHIVEIIADTLGLGYAYRRYNANFGG